MIYYWILPQGAKLVVEEIPYVKSVAIGVYIKVGSRHEKENMAGASHFIEHMLFKGTEKRTARDIAESFELIGGQLNAYTSKEYTCVYARTLDENIYQAMDIIFDMIFNSRFAAKDFATEKGVVIEEINMYEDTPDELIHDLFTQSLWQDHAMGRPILGTLETVANFSRDEVYHFYKQNYIPSNMVISVAGNVKADKIRPQVEFYLNQFDGKNYTLDSNNQDKPYATVPFITLLPRDTEQIQICLGAPGISYWDKERYTQHVMNSILGGGMSSRLFQTMREELGLAYSVYSYPSNYSDTGSYAIYIGTGPNKIKQFFAAFYEELNRFLGEGVTEEEVYRTKQLLKANMYLGQESVTNRSSRMGKSVMMYGEVVPVEKVMEEVLKVTPAMVRDLAAKLLRPEEISLAAIGPEKVLQEVQHEYKKWFKKE
ncbi:Predicted Zn-dependent peptidase [Thermosyntropha lipolytica DSM 11003]|uniref:Predicted Zn-dependent peptidase n=1 Tax=Thermosyntropha lipolytica DSM 11003 TaxID=1123382 RepID=A0A1M5KUI7_9FIRM|nr:pitrilysin family protein [Thermosyntropha lipolytica]SHG56512.1 Predicted Zn-dependent peptidase [Thermosyntropha lipolytica DSM 11003]